MTTSSAKNVDNAMRRARELKAQKALILVDKKSKILEIGPSYAPIAPKAQGWNTYVLDHASQEDLREKYKRAPYVDLEDIEPVDFIWRGGPQSSAIPAELIGTFDACIASHVLEHVPDPIRFLADIATMLRPDGVLSLVLPDKRYELDHFRPITSTGSWLDAYDRQASRHSWGTLFDCHAHTVHNNGIGFWGPGAQRDFRFSADFKDIDSARVRARANEYIDAHAWVFTPSSFKLIMLEIRMLGLLDFSCEAEPDPSGCEFYMSFRKLASGAASSDHLSSDRMKLLVASQEEGAHEGTVNEPQRRTFFAKKSVDTKAIHEIQMPAATEPTSSHFGYDIPIRLLNMTGGGPDTFEAISNWHITLLQQHIGIDPNHSVIEVGCGIGRDAIPLADVIGPTGNYVGIDIIPDSIAWCENNISRRHQNFRFVLFNVRDQLHNPTGLHKTTSFKIPAEDSSVDRIFLWSVFTHMKIADIRHYLSEFSRVLKPDGKILASWFVVDDAILAKARTVDLTPFHLRFDHQIDEGCYVNDLATPMGAVAYTKEVLLEAFASTGLEMVGDILRGQWSGFFAEPKGGQDMTILRLNPAAQIHRIPTSQIDRNPRDQIERPNKVVRAWRRLYNAI